jgi:GNAT superfamily N-acetyltransferase
MGSLVVRQARAEDAKAMARIHVQSWRETYRGLMADEILDRPDFVERRERFWTAALGDERYSANIVAVAERGGELVGIASAGPAEDPDARWPVQLFVLYVLAADHGTGAGGDLLAAVIGDDPAGLWVADPNPRAQAFYRKHGFRPDGARKHDGALDIDEIRMVRPAVQPHPEAATDGCAIMGL